MSTSNVHQSIFISDRVNMLLFLTLSVITLSCTLVDTASILAVFPTPSISHQVVFRVVTQELAKRGHDLIVITPNPAFPQGETPPRLTEIDVHDKLYKIWAEIFMKTSKGNKGDILTQAKILYESSVHLVDAVLQTKKVQNILSEKKFDLLLLESCVKPLLGLSYVFKETPVVFISSFGAVPGDFELMGASEHPILYPNMLQQKLYNLSMWEKVVNIYKYYQIKKIFENSLAIYNDVLRKHFGDNVPRIEDLGNNIDLMLLNANPVFDGSHPVPSNTVYLGGLHLNPQKPLPADLKEYLDSSKNGVIYVSFGTNVDSTLLPAERVQTLVRAFSKVPYDVLFKWDSEELPNRSDNIKILRWLPQSDLLRHPKIKLFITQGGLQSTDEAITAGVPLIGIPMLGDQWYNVQKYVYHKIGIELDLETLTEEQLRNAINTIATDESYRQNIIRLRNLMLDQPMKPLDKAMWWIEHVLRHGGAKHLRAPTANISWSEYLELELLFIVLIAILFFVTIIIAGVFLIYKYITSSSIGVKIKQQ